MNSGNLPVAGALADEALDLSLREGSPVFSVARILSK